MSNLLITFFTNPNDKKFVIISGESKLNEVVGYGDKMTENPNDQPPYFKLFLKEYERVVKECALKLQLLPHSVYQTKGRTLA